MTRRQLALIVALVIRWRFDADYSTGFIRTLRNDVIIR